VFGHSGVGKSSLLNALEPELRLETGEISPAGPRAPHDPRGPPTCACPATRSIDTPGVREIGSGPVDPDLLGLIHPDIALLAARCRFRDCRHASEPDCAVRLAVEEKRLPAARLASYHPLVEEARA
jgi:ribosome biogenesis GTPase